MRSTPLILFKGNPVITGEILLQRAGYAEIMHFTYMWKSCWISSWIAGEMRCYMFVWRHTNNFVSMFNSYWPSDAIWSHASWSTFYTKPWWRHQMETFSAWLAICAGNSPVPGEFTALRPVTRSFDVFFDLRLNKRLSKQPWGWWFETPSWSLWRHCNAAEYSAVLYIRSMFSS